ncbi:phage tail tape measure protein [Curtobacterium sp. SORGH_AS_0776]|uniref:phage tail tape measure protein n=1 Tax=Curtobacterium sp. SORGH_AS_0776 TaxID=3041798 RepID=UPI0028655361|nr:phage tail tape measure protein [Curtobacterium sp. SORGH_AS_0776]MDR6172654.1 TP901 family phage tail tape measure protein [Curtobacterium sp. SORGH_AS_0776]
MADRVVSVSIRAEVAGYLAGMEKVRAATAKTSDEAQKLEKQSAAFEKVGAGLLTIGAAAAAAMALAVKSFADFDAQMSQVQSLSHATAAEMDTLRNAALTMGQSIGFSATEVADAETELVKAGISVKDIMGGALKGALDLAAAGQINVAEATEIAATAMTQFGLSGKDIPHVADLLAAGADKSLGGVEELGAALKQSGLVAAQFGLSVDDTVGVLAEFASAGLMGSDAGTSLKQMFLQLATPTKQASDAMKQYHISAYDANGDFVGLTSLADQLQKGFKGVDSASRDSALGIIFGSDAIRAANILYKDGAKGTREWVNSVNDAGFAAQQAAGKTDNLNGDVKKLGAALESGLIKSGSASNDMLRDLVQNVTAAARAFSEAPSWVQGTALGLTALVGATALAGGGFLTLVPKIAAAKAAMVDLNLTGKAMAVGLGKGGAIFVGVAALASAFAALGSQAQLTDEQVSKVNAALTAKSSKALNQTFSGGGGAFDAFGKDAKSAKDALDGLTQGTGPVNVAFGKMFDGLTFGLTHVSDTSKRFEAQFRQIGTTLASTAGSDLASASKGFNSLVKQMGGGSDTAKRLLDQLGPYKAELIDLAGAQGKTLSEQELLNLAQGKGKLAAQLAAESTQKQKEQLAELSGVASEANQDISQLADSIRNFGSTQLDVESTESDFQAAIDDAAAALKENGKSLDLNTEKGRANAAALRQIAQDGVAATAAIAENGGTQEDAAAKMQSTRDAYIKAAEQFGLTKDQAVAMADQLKLIPDNVSTLFEQQGAEGVVGAAKNVEAAADKATQKKILKVQGEVQDAQDKLESVKKKLASVPASKKTKVQAEVAQANADLLSVLRTLNQLQSKTLTVTTVNRKVDEAVSAGAARGAAGAAYNRASGGAVYGPGTATSDSIPAMLSNGEYVIKASSVARYGTPFLDRVNAGHYANGGYVQKFASGGSVSKAQKAAEKAAKERQRQLKAARAAQYRAAAARRKSWSDVYDFNTAMRTGQLTGSNAVQRAFSLATDTRFPEQFRNAVGRVADQSEKKMLALEKQSTSAAAAVEKASSKLGDLKSSATSMASAVQSKLSDVSYGNYRSGASLLTGLTSRAGKLKQFQGLLVSLQKNGLAPALLNEIASLGVDEGMPLAKSLAAMSKGQLSAINTQYGAVQSTSAAIGSQVADANFGKLIDTAERQLRDAKANAAGISKAITTESRKLQRLIGKALGVPGYSVGGYTGDYGTGQVAGLVHGREFVVNAAATAQNRGWLEAINSGGSVRYMDATPMRAQTAAPASPVRTGDRHYHLTTLDPEPFVQAVERRERSEYA